MIPNCTGPVQVSMKKEDMGLVMTSEVSEFIFDNSIVVVINNTLFTIVFSSSYNFYVVNQFESNEISDLISLQLSVCRSTSIVAYQYLKD